jgi:hypothetical protein
LPWCVICAAADVQLLAAALKQPKMAAVIEAAMRTEGAQLMQEGEPKHQPLYPAAYSAALRNTEGQRVLLALLGSLTGRFSTQAPGSSSSSGGSSDAAASQHAAVTAEHAAAASGFTAAGTAGKPQAQRQQQQQSQMLASLLTTCLKAAVARVAWSEDQQDATPYTLGAELPAELHVRLFHGALNQAAVVAELCCLLGGSSPALSGSSGSSSTASASGSRSGSSSSSSTSSDSAADRSRQWLALGAKSLALLCQWLSQAEKDVLEQAGLADDGPDAAWRVLYVTGGLLSLSDLLRICSSTLDWLGQQLAAVGLPGLRIEEGQQQDAAAQQAVGKLVKQQAAAAKKLAAAAAALKAVRASSGVVQLRDADGTVHMMHAVLGEAADDTVTSDSDVKSCKRLQDSLAASRAALGEFASNLVAQCPEASSCGNPSCVEFGMLSEKKLVAAKKTQCSKCKAARYCSRECQLHAWERHRPVCKRLRAADANSGV